MKFKTLAFCLCLVAGVVSHGQITRGLTRTVYVERVVERTVERYAGDLVVPEGARYVVVKDSTFGGGLVVNGDDVTVTGNRLVIERGGTGVTLAGVSNAQLSNNTFDLRCAK